MTKKLTILVDTREQKPFKFDPSRFKVRTATLQTGDYSVLGLKATVALERKSIGDLFGSMAGKNFVRLTAELDRMKGFPYAGFIVEGTPMGVAAGYKYSQQSGRMLLDRILRMCMARDIQFLLGGSRLGATMLAASFLAQSARLMQGDE